MHELNGIGENYQDHPVVFMTYEGPKESKVDWVVPRFRLIIRKNPISEAANFHINMRPPTEVTGLKRMMPISSHLLEQRNRGRVFLQSADPHDQLGIDSCMLEHPEDLKAMVESMQFIDELVRQPQIKEYYGPIIQPGPVKTGASLRARPMTVTTTVSVPAKWGRRRIRWLWSTSDCACTACKICGSATRRSCRW